MTTETADLEREATLAPGLTPAVRQRLYEQMVLSRAFETEAERQYKAARIGGYSGQEATPPVRVLRWPRSPSSGRDAGTTTANTAPTDRRE
jgi:hypothetical protein